MPHTLHYQMTLPRSIDETFAFFAEAGNLEKITPPELCFRIVSRRPLTLAEGTEIDYRLRLFRIPFGWRTRISRWQPPRLFVDQQIRGPYRLWVHTHTFEAIDEGTRITDRVDYRLPLFPFGEPAFPWVRLELDRIFRFRRLAIIRLAGRADANEPFAIAPPLPAAK